MWKRVGGAGIRRGRGRDRAALSILEQPPLVPVPQVAIANFNGYDRRGLHHKRKLVDPEEKRVLAMLVHALALFVGQIRDPAGARKQFGDFPVCAVMVQRQIGIYAAPALDEPLARVGGEEQGDLFSALVRIFQGHGHG